MAVEMCRGTIAEIAMWEIVALDAGQYDGQAGGGAAGRDRAGQMLE